MDPLLVDFRRGPTAYLSSRGISSQNLVDEILQVAEERVEHEPPCIHVSSYCAPATEMCDIRLRDISLLVPLQLLMTPSDKNDAAKLAALGVFQEMVSPW